MAVYTNLTKDDIEGFLAQYDVGELVSFEGITEGVSNTNYLLIVSPSPLRGEGGVGGSSAGIHTAATPHPNLPPQGGKEQYILTLFEKRINIEDLPYFTSLMEWWHARGIHCPQPIHMRDGRVLSALKERPALLVGFLEGGGVTNITVPHLLQLGKLVAQMHLTGMEFPHVRANGLSLSAWEGIIDSIHGRADEIEPGLFRLVAEEYNYLSEHWPQELPGGPIHADLFPDNVFFLKSPLRLSGVIDFYFACNDAWAYDLAICVNAWCFDARHRLVPERVQALMESYTQERSLTPEEEASFPLLLRGAALRFLLTRTQDWINRSEGAVITLKDPMEYVEKLRWWQRGMTGLLDD